MGVHMLAEMNQLLVVSKMNIKLNCRHYSSWTWIISPNSWEFRSNIREANQVWNQIIYLLAKSQDLGIRYQKGLGVMHFGPNILKARFFFISVKFEGNYSFHDSLYYCTAIPNREVQGFYREIRVQGNSNYMLCQCTGFEGSNFNEIQGNICILYRN